MTGAWAQLVLFGPVPVHLGQPSQVTGRRICADCRADLAVTGAWDLLGRCHGCPGRVVPVPRWMTLMTLGDALAMHEPAEAGLPLEEAA